MITITLQRDKCIGCNYCKEHAPQRFTMSKKDGKAVLITAQERKGFYTTKVHESEQDAILNAAHACPVKIIKITT